MAETEETNSQAGQNQTTEGGQFAIQKIYIKDISFETPHSPAIFVEKWKPDIKLQLRSEATPQSEGLYEVVLTLIVTAQQGDKTAYLVELQQAGVFTVKGFAEPQLAPMLGSYCPSILFPFAREGVANLVIKGGFPQLLLAPVNFDALLAQQLQAKGASGETRQ